MLSMERVIVLTSRGDECGALDGGWVDSCSRLFGEEGGKGLHPRGQSLLLLPYYKVGFTFLAIEVLTIVVFNTSLAY